MRLTHGWRTLGCVVGAVAALACGDDVVVEEAPERIGWSVPDGSEERQPGENEAPRVHRVTFSPSEPGAGERVRAIVEASDPNGDTPELAFLWSIGGEVQPENGHELELGELLPGEVISVQVTASDGTATSEATQASVRVRNRRPAVTRLMLQPAGSVSLGKPITAVAEGRDPDASPLTFRYTWLVNGRSIDDGPSLDTESLRPGDLIQVSVIANDGMDDSDAIESAPVRVIAGQPEIVSSPSGTLQDGEFRYSVEARDPDGDRNLRYYLTAAPKGMTINALKGEVRWTPTAAQAGKHPVEIAVENSGGQRGTQTFELTIESDAAQPPAAEAP